MAVKPVEGQLFVFPQLGHKTEAVGSLPRSIPAASQAIVTSGSFQSALTIGSFKVRIQNIPAREYRRCDLHVVSSPWPVVQNRLHELCTRPRHFPATAKLIARIQGRAKRVACVDVGFRCGRATARKRLVNRRLWSFSAVFNPLSFQCPQARGSSAIHGVSRPNQSFPGSLVWSRR